MNGTTVSNDRPIRTAGLELLGEMPGTAFAERKFLARRGGAYLQLTEVLYRILELADGAHDCERIAAYASAATGRAISAADVRELVAARLVPGGLIGGRDAPAPRAASPLAVNLRAVVLGARPIDVIARVASPLFAPAVALAVIAATIGTRVWLYTHHGIADAVRDVVFRPGVMVAVVALVVASAVLHEIGHAAALRRAGGRSRGMGIGFYLIYPVFYTDVSDGYRLGKWRRVLTDVGGFYMNLVFGLATIAGYLATGQEFVLASVMLTDIEILHQLLPLGRLDGYWLLADITGVPDFFSGAGPFLRSLVPFGRKTTTNAVRPIARVVYATYLLVIGPAFALLGYAIGNSAPRLLAASMESFLRQSDALDAAREQHDLAAGLAAVAQGMLLVVPLVAIAMFFVTLAVAAARLVWRVSGRSRAERLLGATSLAAAAVLVGLLWSRPQAPITAADALAEAPRGIARIVRDIAPIVAVASPTASAEPSATPTAPSAAPAMTPPTQSVPSLTVPTITAPRAPAATPPPTATQPPPSPSTTPSPTASPTPTATPSPTTTGSTK